MKKILTAIFGILILASAIFTVSAKEVTASLPKFKVTLNGVVVENSSREYPLIVYNDITYFPMTYYDCRFLGLTTDWNDIERQLSIAKENITCAYRDYAVQNINPEKFTATLCDFGISVNNTTIDNSKEDYPLLLFRDVTYFPLTWRFAYEEFGWEYEFTHENGLIINSDNYTPYITDFPNRTGAVMFDGNYFYYMSTQGEDTFVYSVYKETPNTPYIIHQIAKTPMSSMGARFIDSSDGVYISYTAGTSPIMSSRLTYKLQGGSRNAVVAYPDAYSYGNHGWFETKIRNKTISVDEEHMFDGASKITYTKDGKTTEAPALPGRVQIGTKRNGIVPNIAIESCIKIFEDKIYFTAVDISSEAKASDLYVIDTNTNEIRKLLYDVCGFHVYKGWSNQHNSDTVMILYDKDGVTMRYTEIDEKSQVVDNSGDTEGLVMKNAVGDYQIYAIYQSADGKKTIVKTFDAYASGYSSLNSKIFESNSGVQSKICDGKLVVYVNSEAYEDSVRLMVLGDGVDFRTSDVPSTEHIKNDVLTYTLYDGTCLRVDLK